jgi:hypothetical protein
MEALLGTSKLALLGELAVCLPAGVVVFYAGCWLTNVPELELATVALAGPLARRLGGRRAKIL